jgi:uncharacterized protein (DUF1778 family)
MDIAMYGKTPCTLDMPPTSKRKTARMELRLTSASKKVIERAVALSGLAPSELAYDAARRVIEDDERFVLREADRQVFLRAVDNPPRPSARLVAALKRHRAATRHGR